MKIYFVRHGQTTFNKEKRHQFSDTPLSDRGLKQAEFVAKRFETIPVDLIVSSTYTRALQTAQKIQEVTQKEIITTDLLIEKRHPSIFWGKLRSEPAVVTIKDLVKQNSHDKTWHHSDEENFHDVHQRAKRALQFLLDQNKENIIAITHGYMLSLFAMTMMLGDNITYDLHHVFDKFAHSQNTGITMCEYTEDTWKLLTWNDYAHLGE